MSALASYLQSLNSAESQWGVWVNPENPTEEYRIGQYIFENGGLDDGWVSIGTLESLSFGYQSTIDAIKEYLEDNETSGFEFEGKTVRYSVGGIVDAYSEDSLDDAFRTFLESEAVKIEAVWSEFEAEDFVTNNLPDILESAANAQAEYALYA